MKKNGVVVLLILLIISVIVGTYLILNKDNKNNSDNNVQDNSEKQDNNTNSDEPLELTVEDLSLANSLIDNFNILKSHFGIINSFGKIYKNGVTLSSDIDNDLILNLGLYKYVRNNDPFENLSYVGNDSVVISAENINESIISIFGNNIHYENADIVPSCMIQASGKYDSSSDTYIFTKSKGCGGALVPSLQSKIVDVKKYNDYLEITEKIYYIMYDVVDSNRYMLIYDNPTDKNLIVRLPEQDSSVIFDTYLDKLDSYKYTFKKENANYYFEKLEKLSE